MYYLKTFKRFIKENKKIEEYLYSKNIIFFFKYKENLYGAKEEDRIAFAKMKSNKKSDKNILNIYSNNFEAYDIKKLLKNKKSIKKFHLKDLKKIKVIQIKDIKKEIKNG